MFQHADVKKGKKTLDPAVEDFLTAALPLRYAWTCLTQLISPYKRSAVCLCVESCKVKKSILG
jgi:hypothetical protein